MSEKSNKIMDEVIPKRYADPDDESPIEDAVVFVLDYLNQFTFSSKIQILTRTKRELVEREKRFIETKHEELSTIKKDFEEALRP